MEALRVCTLNFDFADPWSGGLFAVDCPGVASEISATNLYVGKLPDERKRRRPKLWIIRQGLHPHPGPTIYDCGLDDSDGGGWANDGGDPSEMSEADGWRTDHAEGHSVYDGMLLDPSGNQ